MCYRMATRKSVCLLLVLLAATAVFSHSYAPETRGRKLFGGYRIVPKVCKPTIPARVKTDEPAICMFNYECSRRNGEVVGACMDGFLFGACCQLPAKNSMNGGLEKVSSAEELLHAHEVDHVPDIPILLNPDGTPLGMSIPQASTVKSETSESTNHLDNGETTYTKISTFSPSGTTAKPSTTGAIHNMDRIENAEKPQLPLQPDISHLEEDFPALLGQQSILDDLNLPGLLTHSDSNNDIQDHQDNTAVNPVTTLLSPDQILQIADPVDQLPALFSQGWGQNNYTADTILLNENGTKLDEPNYPDDFYNPSTILDGTSFTQAIQSQKETEEGISVTERTATTQRVDSAESKHPSTEYSKIEQSSTHHQSNSASQWVRFPDATSATEPTTPPMSQLPLVTQTYSNTEKPTTASLGDQYTMLENFEKLSTIEERVSTRHEEAESEKNTTPMTGLDDKKDDLIRVPTITYDAPSGNKKNDVVDKEELAINHIISILNDTTPGSDNTVTLQHSSSPIHTWVSIDESSKPTLIKVSPTKPATLTTGTHTFPYTFYKPSSAYYNYETIPTEATNSHPSRPSTQVSYADSSNFGYSTRSTTNPPAPTVIVLGPLGTEFTTETTQKSVTRKPTTAITRPSLITAKPTSGSLRPSVANTKKPTVSTTITHNISTVISHVAANNNHVVSTSYISLNVKDGTSAKPTMTTIPAISTEAIGANTGTNAKITTKRPTIWTTMTSWSDKPSFFLKPSTAAVSWQHENLTSGDTLIFKDEFTTEFKPTTHTPCEDETAAPDDLINFPPVRNPNLNISAPTSQQEKPTVVHPFNHTAYPDLVSENDIPTPTFIEDDVLTNKVDAFVHKIVESLQGNFQDLKDVVYKRNNTGPPAQPIPTKRPTTIASTTKRPTRRPGQNTKPSSITTRRPATTRRPTTRPSATRPSFSEKPTRVPKPTTPKPKPTTPAGIPTKRPQTTTKRPRPTRKPTTTIVPSTEAVLHQEEEASTVAATEAISTTTTTVGAPDFKTQCGVRPLVKQGRIVGGKAATFGQWPWQVLVREATWLGLFTKNKCGGVLITDKYVITAAHCQPGFLATLVAVFGEFDLSGELEPKRSVTRNVRRVVVNRAYDPATFENDLALLELETPVQFDAHIVPICMPEDGIDFTGRMATVTGWGRLKYNGGVPSVLQEVQVPIMENSVCQEMFQTAGHSKLILESFLCAGYANGQKDSCEGDSGGPLVMERPDGRWFLVGTVSHGIKCASPYLPGVYMRTAYFKPWLHSITGV